MICDRDCQSDRAFSQTHDAFRLPRRDVLFLEQIYMFDVLRHEPGLRALAHEKFPDTPYEDLGVSIDYSQDDGIIMDVFVPNSEDPVRGAVSS